MLSLSKRCDLQTLTSLPPDELPTFFMGRLSDPTSSSFTEWVLSFCYSRDYNPDHVNEYLKKVVSEVSKKIGDKALDDKTCKLLEKSIAKLKALVRILFPIETAWDRNPIRVGPRYFALAFSYVAMANELKRAAYQNKSYEKYAEQERAFLS